MLSQTKALLEESHQNLDVAITTALDRKNRALDEETEDLYVNVWAELMQIVRARADGHEVAVIRHAPSRLTRQWRLYVDGRYASKFLTLDEAQAYVAAWHPTAHLSVEA